MISRFHIRNFKALRDVRLTLTPIHVFIGPNNSGKSSILQALATFCRTVDLPVTAAVEGHWQGRELVWNGARTDVVLSGSVGAQSSTFDYSLHFRFPESGREVRIAREEIEHSEYGKTSSANEAELATTWVCDNRNNPRTEFVLAHTVHEALEGVHSYRWSARDLARPASLDPGLRLRLTETGFGLVTLLDDLNSEFNKNYDQLKVRFSELFPDVEQIKLLRESAFQLHRNPLGEYHTPVAEGKGLYFELKSGAVIPASQASDGMLVVLAYLAILSLPKPPLLLLIEEPENGLHPHRLRRVVDILRELVGENGKTQIVLTTHSPYLLDCFDPTEVTVCGKDENGAVVTRRLSQIPRVQKESAVFSLGEIWGGVDDESLLAGSSEPEDAA